MSSAICGCFGNPWYDPVIECKTCKNRVACRKAILKNASPDKLPIYRQNTENQKYGECQDKCKDYVKFKILIEAEIRMSPSCDGVKTVEEMKAWIKDSYVIECIDSFKVIKVTKK